MRLSLINRLLVILMLALSALTSSQAKYFKAAKNSSANSSFTSVPAANSSAIDLMVSKNIYIDAENNHIIELKANNLPSIESEYLFVSVFEIYNGNKHWLSNLSLPIDKENASTLINRAALNFKSSETNKLINFDVFDAQFNKLSTHNLELKLSDTEKTDSSIKLASNLYDEDSLRDIYRRVFLTYSSESTNSRLENVNDYYILHLPEPFIKIKDRTSVPKKVEQIAADEDFIPIIDFESLEDFEATCTTISQTNTQIVTGPPGPAGANGAAGPAGAQGIAGDPGIDGAPGKGAFSTTANVTSNAQANSYATADFVFGSPQLDDDGDPNHDGRFFFDKSKYAFRAGKAESTQWDDVNRGLGSVALGLNGIASGDYSAVFGPNSTASGLVAVSIGSGNLASGDNSIVIGSDSTASASKSIAIGNNAISSAASAVAMGRFVQATNTGSFVIGKGNSIGDPLINNTPNSLVVASNSNQATLFVGAASGGSTRGNIGIGTINPARTLHISGALRLEPQAAPPGGASNGDLYYDTSHALCARINGSWVVINGGGACS